MRDAISTFIFSHFMETKYTLRTWTLQLCLYVGHILFIDKDFQTLYGLVLELNQLLRDIFYCFWIDCLRKKVGSASGDVESRQGSCDSTGLK